MVKISIVIPAYNEEKRIGKTLKSYCDFLKKKKCDYEILVVINGTTDNTEEIVKKFSKDNVHYIVLKEGGKGNAIIQGFKEVKGDLICYVDADNATKVDQLWLLKMNLGNYDGIMGSRWMKNSIILRKQPLPRRFVSRGFNFLVRNILYIDFKDTQNGGKIFTKKLIQDVLPYLKVRGWGFDVAILYYSLKKGYRIKEFPVEWEDDPNSKLKMRKAIPGMLKTLLELKFKK